MHCLPLNASGLIVDAATANAEVGKWLRDVANRHVYPQTGHAPLTLFENVEKALLLTLPAYAPRCQPERPVPRPVRDQIHTLQHPLSIYQQILTEVVA